MLKKTDVPAPSPTQEETVSVPELNGEVLVRGLLLKDRFEISLVERYGRLSSALAACVFVAGANGEMVPLYTADEWERWGSKANRHVVALELFAVIQRLSDIDGTQAEKKSSAQISDSPAA